MDLIVDPPRGVGPIAIGMPFDKAELALKSIAGFVPPEPGGRVAPGFAHYDSEMSIAVGQDRSRNVRSIEVYRPSRDVNVLFRGISVFGLAADEVIRRISDVARLEIEDGGRQVLAPELLLSLWRGTLPGRPEDEDGRYFEAVLAAAPGYYD
ncbi:hypothetical protein ORV05_23695 [Amycolatopsis cynarae]|uniref:DUF3168 domain-containing protein n=1 Tax=Amycolatopsis cynarae TaxID=2995223 RepID=A0ABY7AYG4_9PSEU|nr:hypothetical protein [Amycolatopsis sp. HUAS 11-8]WAL63982.1 hypothetical protein ORV05_23695 [Amycolatopsis sp. HUAS 11-8]